MSPPPVPTGSWKADPLWAKSCLAYNVHADLAPSCRAELVRLQLRLCGDETRLLRCPPAALHVSLASLVLVRRDHALDKELLWARHGVAWTAALGEIASELPSFVIRFSRIVVTDTAVIVLAEPSEEVDTLRAGVARLRSDAGLEGGQPTIVHTTLLRYGTEPFDSQGLLERADAESTDASSLVSRLVLYKELIYPSLVNEEVAQFTLVEEPRPVPLTDR